MLSLNRKGSILALSSPRECPSRTKEKSFSVKKSELIENADTQSLPPKYLDENEIVNNREIIRRENENVNDFESQIEECPSSDSGTSFMDEIMSKKVLNIFERISSVDEHSKIRISSQQQNTNLPSKTPKSAEFRVLCTALVIAYKNSSKIKSEMIKDEKNEKNDKKIKHKIIHTTSPGNEVEKTDRVTDQLTATYEHEHQLQLQQALDDLNMNDVATAVALGAVVEPAHVRQAALHFGDEYVSLFAFLLSCGEIYIADR